jgi:hypothetical protein
VPRKEGDEWKRNDPASADASHLRMFKASATVVFVAKDNEDLRDAAVDALSEAVKVNLTDALDKPGPVEVTSAEDLPEGWSKLDHPWGELGEAVDCEDALRWMLEDRARAWLEERFNPRGWLFVTPEEFVEFATYISELEKRKLIKYARHGTYELLVDPEESR